MSIDDDTLVERFAASKDEELFRLLYRRHTPRLYALALRVTTGSGPDAEEIVQETWVRAVERLHRFERRSSLRTWLSGILLNCSRELGRRRWRTPRSLTDVEEGSPEADRPRNRTEGSRAEAIDVERAVARLPDGYREVVVLHDVNGHTHREIAELLDIDEGTSKSQLARGRARLRALLRVEPAPAAGTGEGGTT